MDLWEGWRVGVGAGGGGEERAAITFLSPGLGLQTVEDTARDVLIAAFERERETLPLPSLAPGAPKAARQSLGGLEASAAETAGSARGTRLPALETCCRSARGRAKAREQLPPLSAAVMCLECRESLAKEDRKAVHLPLPALQQAKREAGALPQAIQAPVRCLPEARPGSSALGKARLLRADGARTSLRVQSRQLPGGTCFVAGAPSIPQRQMRGMPACKEQDEPWPGCLTEPRLPPSPLRVAFLRTVEGLCQELGSKVLAAPRDACAQDAEAQWLETMAHRQDLVRSKASASQGVELQPAEGQVSPAENAQGESASSGVGEVPPWETMAKGVSQQVWLGRPRFAEVPPSSAKAVAGSCHREMAAPESMSPSWPEPAGFVENIRADACMEMRAENQRPAPHGPALPAAPLMHALLALASAALSRPDDARAGHGRELRAAVPQRTLAYTLALANLASALWKESRERVKTTAATALQGPDCKSRGGKRKVMGAGAPASLGRGNELVTLRWQLAARRPKQQPLGIVCRLRGTRLHIHPDNPSRYLAVLSIKTETLEELDRSCVARTGQSLAQLREACLERKEARPKESEVEEEEGKGKRFSLTASGCLNVRPKEVSAKGGRGQVVTLRVLGPAAVPCCNSVLVAVLAGPRGALLVGKAAAFTNLPLWLQLCARNSFYNLWQPEVTRVELLKDARSKWEVLERLYAHAPRREREPGAGKRVRGAPEDAGVEWSDEEEDVEEEPLQGEELEENTALVMSWVRPSLRSLLAETQPCPEEVPSSPVVKGRDAAREAAGDLQSTPLAPAVPRGAEAAASPLAGGCQDAGDSVPLAPPATTGTKAEASPAARDPEDAGENAPLPPWLPTEAAPEASHLSGGPCGESNSLPLQPPLPEESAAEGSALAAGLPQQVSKEHGVGTQHPRAARCEQCLGCAGWVRRAAPWHGSPAAVVRSCPPSPLPSALCPGEDAWCSAFPSARGPGLTCPARPAQRAALGHGC